MSKVAYISLSNYLKIKSRLTDDLILDRSKLRFTHIIKQFGKSKKQTEHDVRMNVYLEVDRNWINKARTLIKKYDSFDILKEEKKKVLKTTTVVNDFLDF